MHADQRGGARQPSSSTRRVGNALSVGIDLITLSCFKSENMSSTTKGFRDLMIRYKQQDLTIYAVGWRVKDEQGRYEQDIWSERFLRFKLDVRKDFLGGCYILREAMISVLHKENLDCSQTGLITALPHKKTASASNSVLYRAGQWISSQIGIEWCSDLLAKGIHAPLHSLDRDGRLAEVSNKYICKETGLDNLIVLDDFITTGNTIKEIGRAVHQCNPSTRVIGLVLGKHADRAYPLFSIPHPPNKDFPLEWAEIWENALDYMDF